ncbi:CDP-glycerol glycerophosphotransferase family protein [Clostridium botulinum]|uniref:CDP-glycerol glycerophosphotransferase family protein n=1 Tax=Clostridium botulinum TaxID=1491 RepID=UPI00196883A3
MCEISVIIPAYNVEQYLDECFDSLINQTYKEFEIIVVNDGSTDSTRCMLEQYCGIVDNLIVINQENSGSAGGPRNKGINRAKGKYIFFLDPDDKLPYTALETLHSKIIKSNADICCGNYNKFKKNSMWTLKHVTEKIYYSERITTFNDEIGFANNIIAWNKLYNKKFLIENNIYFDENLRYGEDRSFVMKAYTHADSIHIIPNCIYNYRERESQNNKSATQEFTLKIFNESIEACKMDVDILNFQKCKYTTKHIYNKERVQHDFLRFLDYYAKNDANVEKWKKIIEMSKAYIKLLDNNMNNLSYIQRKKINYLIEEDIEGLKKYIKNKKKLYRCIYKNKKFKIQDLTDIKCLNQKKNEYITEEDLNLFYKIENLKIDKEILYTSGWAYIHRFQMNVKECVDKHLVFKGYKQEFLVDLESVKRRDISLKKGKVLFNYLYSGFKGQVSLQSLKDLVNEKERNVKIYLRLVINKKIYKEVYINDLDIYGYMNRENNYYTITQRVESIDLTETHLKMSGWALINYDSYESYTDVDKKIIFVNRDTMEEYTYSLCNKKNQWCNNEFEVNPYKYYYGYPGWNFSISLEDIELGIYDIYIEVCNNSVCVREKLKYPSVKLMKKRRTLDKGFINFNKRYKFEFTTSEYNREKCEILFIAQDLDDFKYELNGGCTPIIGKKSNYWDAKSNDILLKKIAVTYTNFQFWGTFLCTNLNKKNLILQDKQGEKYSFPCSSYEFLYLNKKNNGWRRFVSYNIDGHYTIKLEILESNNELQIVDKFKLSKELCHNNDVWNKEHYISNTKLKFIKKKDLVESDLYTIEVIINNSRKNKYVGIKKKLINRLLKYIDKIIKKSKLLKKIKNKGFKFKTSIYLGLYRILSYLPVNYNKITLVSYDEKLPKDYLTFCEEIKLKNDNLDIVFIGGNEKTLSEYIKMSYRFATSGTIMINNYYRHLYNVKHRKEIKYIQLWHATGIFKRFGLLAVGKNQANSEAFEINAHHYYTHVIVSGDEIVKPYAKAFGLPENKVIPLGVSRTDEFFNINEHERIKEKIYKIYPMFRGKKIILYAPTFRGNDSERKVFRNQLEFDKLSTLKEEGYVVLYKMHPVVQEPLYIPQQVKGFIYDVTQYPNINELFYITDILITDYSSSVFEFSLLKKPMIFFAYDLDKYLNERGFYYDYVDFIPGPICKKTDEIINCIKNLDNINFDYDEFIKKHINRCDGHATERLIELIRN